MDIIQNRDKAPEMNEIGKYITGELKREWNDMTGYIESAFKAKPQVVYSGCTAKPGWNVKYKKSGKALCTLYPEKEGFTVLIVLSLKDMDLFDTVREGYTDFVNRLYDKTGLFNGTKWLMIRVSDGRIAEDVKKLMHLKMEAAVKK